MMNIEKISVLLIEDYKSAQFVVKKLLGEATLWSFDIECCTALSEALSLIKSKKFDVILADLELPDSSKENTLSELNKEIKETPFIVLTATNEDSLFLKSLRAGAQDYVCKDHIMNGPLLSRSLYYAVQQWKMREKLEFLATHDSLTNVMNKRSFMSLLDRAVVMADRYDDGFCLLICDIDDLGQINEKYGHLTGDRALIEFTQTVQSGIRDTDDIARFGGDEFLILINRVDREECLAFMERLTTEKILVSPEDGTLEDISLKTSFGGVWYKKGISSQKMIDQAVKALSEVKEKNKGNFLIY